MKKNETLQFIFNRFPELSKIGNLEQYGAYLKTIFPHSVSKSIFFHGGRKGITTFIPPSNKKEFTRNKGVNSATKDYGIYFTADRSLAKYYASAWPKDDRQIYAVMLNMQNPLQTKAWFALNIRRALGAKNLLNPQAITSNDYQKFISSKGYDSILWHGERGEAIVFNPEQIHIIGSTQDINMFQKWIDNQHQSSENTSNLPNSIDTQQKIAFLRTQIKNSDNDIEPTQSINHQTDKLITSQIRAFTNILNRKGNNL